MLCCRQLRSPLARVTLVALGCLIGFAPSFRFLIPFGIHRVLPLACAVLIAALLSRSKLQWLPMALSLALAITATFSFANGFLCFAVLWAAMAWTTFLPADSRRPSATPARGPLLLATGLVTLTMGLLYGSQLDRHHLELFAERHRGDSLLTKVGQGFLSWFSAPYDLINDAFNLIFRPLGEGKWMLLGAFILLGLGMAGLFLLASRKGPAAQPLNRPGCFCGSLLIGYFIPTTLMLARYRSKGFGDDRYFCEVTLLSLLIGTVLFLINGRGRLKLPSRLPNMLRLDALVVFAVFTLLPLYYTPPYLMAMQLSLIHI